MKRLLISFFTILICYLILCNPTLTITYAREAMDICCEMIIPTLFPFFICSGLFIYSGFCETLAKLFRFCMKPLFGISPAGSSAFILGIISGYPLGAITAGELYQNHYLSKTEAERLLAFCNNSGPLFILGSVGIAMYTSMKTGVILYTIHILSALTVGILFRFYHKNSYTAPRTTVQTKEHSVGDIFSIALQNGIQTMLTVCGAIVFFSVASRLFLTNLPINDSIEAMTSGIFEFVTGTLKISHLTISMTKKLTLTSFIVGFAGLSVHAQVIATIARYHLSFIPYFIGKFLHGILAAFYMMLYLHFFPVTVSAFAPNLSRSFSTASGVEIVAVLVVSLFCVLFGSGAFQKEN